MASRNDNSTKEIPAITKITLEAVDLANERSSQGLAILSVVQERMMEWVEDDVFLSVPKGAVRESAEALWGALALLRQAAEAIKTGNNDARNLA